MTTESTTKRNVLNRAQYRFVEDALQALAKGAGWSTASRKDVLEELQRLAAPRGFTVTPANLAAAAETLGITLPGSRDADAERDRELLAQMAQLLDDLTDAIDTGAGTITETANLNASLRAWQAFRAGPLFAKKAEAQA